MFPVRRQISPHVSRLRRDATEVEKMVWSALRGRQLGGFKFRRQWTIGSYIVDFACFEALLIVELDGGQHSDESDAARTHFLEAHGYRVLLFWNNDVLDHLDAVLAVILQTIEERAGREKKTLTQPSPAKAGEGSISNGS